jgi:hypothetical protein
MHCTEYVKHTFPAMKLSRLIHNFYIHISVSNLYIPTIGPQQTGGGNILIAHRYSYMNVEIGRQNILILFWK